MRVTTIMSFVFLLPATIFGATPWEKYLLEPSAKNAILVSSMTYEIDTDYEQIELDLLLLESQIKAQDPEAIDLGFKLRAQFDGALAEIMDMTLGELIRPNPILFLKHLKKNRHEVKRIDALIGNFGTAYVDRLQAHKYEVRKRIEALESVKDHGLVELRNECVASLKKK